MDRRQALEHLQALAAALGVRELSAQDVAYRVTSVDPSALEFTDGDWDGDQARDAMPNPSDDDTDLSVLDQGFVFVPEGEEARDTKSNWKCPFRQTPDGPAHVSGLVACLAAINGARSGIEGISEEVLRDGYDFVVDALVAAGHYDDRDEAPAFEATASDDSSASTTDDGLEATDPIAAELTAQATGVIDAGPDAAALLEGADDGGPLMGVIWGAGDHDLSVGGEPTPVHVPAETVSPTFEALQDDVAAGEVTLGFDHPGEDSVAAQTGIVEIGVAENVALSEDERHIVLTDSELTNDQAIEAAEEGAFDDLDWSVVGDVRIRRDDDGDPVREDDRIVLDAVRIRRIDAVTEGAVDAASIVRDRDALPDLQSELQTIQQAAQSPNQQTISAAADALRASADALDDHDMDHFDPDDYDDISEALEAASDVVTERQERIDELASAFEDVLDAAAADDVDVDLEDVDPTDDPDAAAQAVIDAQTADLRQEIAEFEAELASYETSDDAVDQRAQELAGRPASELRAMRNERAYEQVQVEQRQQTRGAAAAQTDTTGRSDATGGQTDTDADAMALSAMDGADRLQALDSDQSPADYLQAEYDVDASQFDDADALRAAVVDAATGGS